MKRAALLGRLLTSTCCALLSRSNKGIVILMLKGKLLLLLLLLRVEVMKLFICAAADAAAGWDGRATAMSRAKRQVPRHSSPSSLMAMVEGPGGICSNTDVQQQGATHMFYSMHGIAEEGPL
jgi:hypothetical protein